MLLSYANVHGESTKRRRTRDYAAESSMYNGTVNSVSSF